MKLKANLRVFVDSSGWPPAFCSWPLPWGVQSISLFTFSNTCELHSKKDLMAQISELEK